MQAPTISVLIPTYNYAHYLPKAIESVLNQTFADFELIIVDDISEDNTAEVVQPYLADPRVTFHTNATNLGLPGNWNRCLELSKGKYIKYLMADDSFHPEMLEKFTAVMEKYPDVSIVTSYKQYKDGENKLMETFHQPFSGLQNGKKIIYESLKTWNWIGEPTTVMFRRENLNLGLFNEQFCWIPDWEMWLRHLNVGNCYIIPEVLSYFRQHEGQVTVKVSKNIERQFEEFLFYKGIRDTNPYNYDLEKIEIDKIMKDKSNKYLRAALKGLKTYNNKSISTLLDAFGSYVTERVSAPKKTSTVQNSVNAVG